MYVKNILFLIGTILLGLSCSTQKTGEIKPNIIFILADDMGYGDVSYLNPAAKTNTPHIDKIGREGIYFSDAHTPSAVCTPTRYGLLTGRYCFRTSLKSGVLVGHSPSLIEPGRQTVASLLKEQGYFTGCIGKWHLGLDWSKKDTTKALYEGNDWDIADTKNVDYEGPVHGGPTDHGFDYSFINPASLDIAPYVYVSNKRVTDSVTHHIKGLNEVRGVFWRHGDIAKDFILEETLDTYGQKAVEFIDSHRDQPFFLYLPLTAPHTPWLPGEDFKGKSGAGTYGDFVMHVDHIVGQVLQSLEKNNLTDRTMIFFTSDNGAHWTDDDKKQYPHLANHVFSGMKSDVWEGGHRVPFLVRWPGHVEPGVTSKEVICLTDMLATFADLYGTAPGENAGEDSFSILPALLNKSHDTPLRPFTVHHSVNGTFAIRKGKWKLVESKGSGGWSYKGNDDDPDVQLYNMEEDIGEKNNLYQQHPDITLELQNLLTAVKEGSTGK